MATDTQPLDSPAFAMACALLWACTVVVLGITARLGWGNRWQRFLADRYRGYDETPTGLATGALWAFIDGFAGGYTFAVVYNRLRRSRIAGGELPGRAIPGVEREPAGWPH